MRYPIRVHTLFLPMQDNIASYILSHPDYIILVNERQMTKSGDVIMHLEYEDHTGLGYDSFNHIASGSYDDTLNLESSLLSEENEIYEEYEPEELKEVSDDSSSNGQAKRRRKSK